MLRLYRHPRIHGFTTNPTLMRKAGITDYRAFALKVVAAIPDRPISFEVLADDLAEMDRQAREIATWGANVYVKIPVTDTRGASTADLVSRLSSAGVKVNVTAVLTLEQVEELALALRSGSDAFVSVFAGRIADTGVDPVPLMAKAVRVLKGAPRTRLIWASCRELLNIFHADSAGCHVITVTHDLLQKIGLVGRSLADYSLETVRMFHDDASRAGLVL
jgi:transaldolase